MYHFWNSLLKNTLHSLTKNPTPHLKKKEKFWVNFIFYVKQQHRGVANVQHWGLFLAVAAADVVLVVLVELDQRTHSLLLEGRGAHRRAPVFFQVGKFLPQKGCLWVYLFHLRLVTRTQALDAAVHIGHYKGERAGGRAGEFSRWI